MDRFKDLATCEANYAGLEFANETNYNLKLWEQGKWEAIYRLVFPEEAPWDYVVTQRSSDGKVLAYHSPYQWDKLIDRLTELLRASGKEPAENWRDGQSV